MTLHEQDVIVSTAKNLADAAKRMDEREQTDATAQAASLLQAVYEQELEELTDLLMSRL